MHICFSVESAHGEGLLEPDYCENRAVGGTETAVVRLAQALRELGCDVSVVVNQKVLPDISPDVYVSTRVWQRFYNQTPPGKLNYLWCHDDIDQPVVKQLKETATAGRVYPHLDGLIMVSHYQASRWVNGLHAPAEKLFVSSNGVDLSRFSIERADLSKRPPKAYFSSTPFRGLPQLLEVWPIVRQAIGPKARLVICSSLKVYGREDDSANQPLYEKARSLEGVEYLGSIGQKQLREVAASCRALAYPCTFPETGCIAAMEAMASGCVVVSTQLGALRETAWRNPLVYLGPGCLDLWIEELLRVLVDDSYYQMQAEENLHLAQLMGWKSVARKWLMRFQSDLVKSALPAVAFC